MLKHAGMALLTAIVLTTFVARGEDAPATAPASAPATASAPAARSDAQLQEDLQAAMEQVQAAMQNPRALMDAEARQKVAPQAVPAMQKVLQILEEVGKANPQQAEATRGLRYQTLSFMALLDDPDAVKTLDTAAAGKNEADALSAKNARNFAAWLKANKDAAAQTKVLDDMQALAKANATSDELAGTLWVMSRLGPANKDTAQRAVDIVTNDLKGESAKRIQAALAQMSKR